MSSFIIARYGLARTKKPIGGFEESRQVGYCSTHTPVIVLHRIQTELSPGKLHSHITHYPFDRRASDKNVTRAHSRFYLIF